MQDDLADSKKLISLMEILLEHNSILKEHLLDSTILRHMSFTIKRDRDIFTPVKIESQENAVSSLFQMRSGNPLNTKEAELFPGFIQVRKKSFSKTLALTESVNLARKEIKSHLISKAKKTCITTDSGVVYTQNPLMFRNYPMLNTMQLYRQLTAIDTNTNKGSFIWQSNKRYLKYDTEKALAILHSAKLAPTPLNVEHKEWENDIEAAIMSMERISPDTVITKICGTEPKPHFKFKPTFQKDWFSHYGATPLIICNHEDSFFSVEKKMQSIDVTNKHINVPIGNQWIPLCRSLHLYYQR